MNTTSKANSMAELMAHQKSSFQTLHKGQQIKGVVTKATTKEVLLDINAKTEAIVMEVDKRLLHALLAIIKVGDTVQAMVISPESESGNPVVSLRKFLEDNIWGKLGDIQKNHEKVRVSVKEITKGGYIVDTPFAMDAFLPNSHVSVKEVGGDLVGKSIDVMIAEMNRELHKLIVSQKPIYAQEDFALLAKNFKQGQKIEVVVSHITSFGVFVSVPVTNVKNEATYLDGLIHVSEASWEKVTDLSDIFTVGKTIEVIVLGVDTNNKRIDLSLKRLTGDPFAEIAKKYVVDQKIKGTVVKVTDQGVVLDIGEGDLAEGFIRKEKVPAEATYSDGQKLDVTVVEVDSKKHRIYLAPVLLDKPLFYR